MKENINSYNLVERGHYNFWNQLNNLLLQNGYTTSDLKFILNRWSEIIGAPIIATWEYKKLCADAKEIIKALKSSFDDGEIYKLFECLETLVDNKKFTDQQLNDFLKNNNIPFFYNCTTREWKKIDSQELLGGNSMEIFLGSSSESKEFMEEIALKLQELGHDTLMWTDTGKGIFAPGTNTIDALIEITKKVDAAVFVFNADDKIWNSNSSLEGVTTVRDNVLFEYGLFTGALGKKKVCFICKNRPSIATDLKGITYINGDQKSLIIKNKLKDWINAMD